MQPFGDLPRPVVMGHRGAPGEAPENTPAAFAAAAAAGAAWVELDTRASADGVVVVHHDAWIADGRAVRDVAADALQAMGVWTFADVLDRLPDGLGVDVELKNLPGEPDYDADEGLTVLVAALLRDCRRPVMTSSFNPATVQASREQLPDVPAGLLTTAGLRTMAGVAIAHEVGAQVYCPHVETPELDVAAVEAAHAAGMTVLVWTVDDLDGAALLAGAGVDALCTNDPRGLVRALG
ncbi:MAG: glycerophosphodiester phosphodiesterase [Egibacteraceae bacterium]